MGYVAKAKPDGYTLLLALSSISIIPEADKVTGRAPMYQLDQFTPIRALHRRSDCARGARGQPVEDVQEFVADARSGPARSRTDRRQLRDRCTFRWRCSQRAPT
jgi:tripartite-type tricarboxylate transporter receptor subunit TctC